MLKNKTRVLVVSALMISISIVLRYLGVMIPFGGANGMRISLSGFFSKIPALLFGPVMGGITSALTDIIGAIVKPEGAYIWALTVTAGIGGIIVGYLWKNIKNISEKSFNKVFIFITCAIGLIAIFNFTSVIFLKDFAYTKFLLSLSKKRYAMLMYGTLAVFILGVITCAVSFIINKKYPEKNKDFMKLLSVFFLANIIVTTLNTFILMIFIPSLGEIGFMLFYIPRLIEEIIMTIVQCFVTSFLLTIIEKLKLN